MLGGGGALLTKKGPTLMLFSLLVWYDSEHCCPTSIDAIEAVLV